MKKLLLILLCLPLLYSCQFEKVKAYEEEVVIQVDTLDIEHIKIETQQTYGFVHLDFSDSLQLGDVLTVNISLADHYPHFNYINNIGYRLKISIGAYDSLGSGEYVMKSDYQSVPITNYIGTWEIKATSVGRRQFSGIMKIEYFYKGRTKYYSFPFRGNYTVIRRKPYRKTYNSKYFLKAA